LNEELKKSAAAGFMDPTKMEHLDPSANDFDLHRPYVDHANLGFSNRKTHDTRTGS
jgi:hypothetical protein